MGVRSLTIDDYLKGVDDTKRAALQRLRKVITSALPDAEECISYQLPAFRVDGRVVLGFGAGTNHCALYPFSGATVEMFKDELKEFQTSKGAIRFQPEEPLSAALLRKIIKSRLAANSAKQQKAGKKTNSGAEGAEKSRVSEAIKQLKHARKKELGLLRRIIMQASPKIREGFKWNSPSYIASDYFATINLHQEDSLRLILHNGTKKSTGKARIKVDDPAKILTWLAKDRCMVTFSEMKDLREKKMALQAIIRQWIAQI